MGIIFPDGKVVAILQEIFSFIASSVPAIQFSLILGPMWLPIIAKNRFFSSKISGRYGVVLLILSLHFQSAVSQVPVYDEPRHRLELVNPYIRLINVNIAGHDTTLYHRHFTPSVIVFLSDSHTGSQPSGGQPSFGHSILGQSMFIDFGSSPVLHRVWNMDTSVYHVMDIEIIDRKEKLECSPLTEPFIHLEWEKEHVRVYNIRLGANQSTKVDATKCPHLVVMASGIAAIKTGDNAGTTMDAGKFEWMEAGIRFQIVNNTNKEAKLVMLELK